MSATNETCKTYACECRLVASVCNEKQRWDSDKCMCECEELIDKGRCNDGSILNPSTCECKCDKPCNAGEYLDYANYKSRKKVIT